MDVDMVFGESASFVCMGCSNIIGALFFCYLAEAIGAPRVGQVQGQLSFAGDLYRFSDAAMRADDALFAHL